MKENTGHYRDSLLLYDSWHSRLVTHFFCAGRSGAEIPLYIEHSFMRLRGCFQVDEYNPLFYQGLETDLVRQRQQMAWSYFIFVIKGVQLVFRPLYP